MKKNLLVLAALISGAFGFAQEDYTEVTVPLQPGYTNQVFYKFSTNTQTASAVSSWDLALLRINNMATGIRVNDGKGIKVYEASNNLENWATIDVTNQAGWTQLYNSETEWPVGALDNGSATYGWGEYNSVNHHVTGTIIFVLKYSDTLYKKLYIEDYFGAYTIKFATWNGTEWSADATATAANTSNAGYTFNFIALDTNTLATVSPADADWDIAFGRYFSDLNAGTELDPMMYLVTGTLQNTTTVQVAVTDETGASTDAPTLPAADAYSDNINTIGDDWKVFNGTAYTTPENITYYVKHTDGNIYRLYFTAFGGSATGDLTFKYKNVTPTAGLEELNANVSFGFYPNPSADKNITLFYDLKNNVSDKNTVSIYSLTGAKVYETELTSNGGFYTKQVNLSNLSSGMYIVKMESGKASVSQKLVIQ